jgi:arylsulfatase A-like enzyme
MIFLLVAVGIFALIGVFLDSFGYYWYYVYRDKILSPPVKSNQDFHWKRVQTNQSTTDLPNVVIVLVNDLDYHDLSIWGELGGGQITPNIVSLKTLGVEFNNAYAAHAASTPSRAAFLTGKFPTRSGYEFSPLPSWKSYFLARYNRFSSVRSKFHAKREKEFNLAAKVGSLPFETLAKAIRRQRQEYRPLFLGQWDTGSCDEATGFDERLSIGAESLYLPSQSSNQDCFINDLEDDIARASFRYQVEKDELGVMEPRGHLTDYIGEEAGRAISANRDRPFFMYVSLPALSLPLQASPELYARSTSILPHASHCERVYAALLMSLDNAVGTIVSSLEDNDLADNTLVIFSSSNGAPSSTRLRPHPLSRGGKYTFFEGGIKVPLLMKWPLRLPRGHVVEQLVSHVDIFPTVLAAAGVPIADGLDGINLLPFVTPPLPTDPSAPSCPSTAHCPTIDNCPANELSCHRHLFWRAGNLLAYREGRMKLHVSQSPWRTWLFDLQDDPGERTNLINDTRYTETLDRLMDSLRRVNASQVPPLWISLCDYAVPIDDSSSPEQDYVYWSC